jgi:hypothetical protein
MLSIINALCQIQVFYAECHYAERHYAEYHFAEFHYAECRYAQCLGTQNKAYKRQHKILKEKN